MNRPDLVETIARQIAPREWKEYDQGNGICTNLASWRILDSLEHAKSALKCLRDNSLLTEKALAILEDNGPEEKA